MDWPQQLQRTDWSQGAICAAVAYALGCAAIGYYLVRARTGRDIRDLHSGSIGAKNVARVLGKTGFFLTLLGDFWKGALAVWLALHFTHNTHAAALAALAVVAGHIWPAQLGFRGGKGVATSLGAMLVFDYRLALAGWRFSPPDSSSRARRLCRACWRLRECRPPRSGSGNAELSWPLSRRWRQSSSSPTVTISGKNSPRCAAPRRNLEPKTHERTHATHR